MTAHSQPNIDIGPATIELLRQHARDYRRIIRALEADELRPVTALIAQLVETEAGARHALITANAAGKRVRLSSPRHRGQR